MTKVLTYIVLGALKAVATLPFGVLYALSDALYYIIRYIVHYRYTVIHDNIQRAFPDKSDAERKRILNKYYRHFCDQTVETVKLLHISDEQLKQRVSVAGTRLVEQAAAEGRPVILYIGHIGNWEWVQEVPSRYSNPRKNAEVYKQIASPIGEQVIRRIRSRFKNNQMMKQNEALRSILRMKQEGEPFLVGFISDQRPRRSDQDHWTTFLNQPTDYITGPEHIGRRIGAKFLYLNILKPRRGHYAMEIIDLQPKEEGEFPYSLEYLRLLEQNIISQPEIWLWSHKRWKHWLNKQKSEKTN